MNAFFYFHSRKNGDLQPMENNNTRLLIVLVALVTFGCSEQNNTKQETAAKTYIPVSQQLYEEIKKMDSLMFAAFNAHEIDKLRAFFSEDVEFYHDKDGKLGFQEMIRGFTGLFERNKTTGLRRDLVPGSLEVYPLKDFGAVETCLHKFCHKENGKDDCGVFKNIMIWQHKQDQWKVTRVISYDH